MTGPAFDVPRLDLMQDDGTVLVLRPDARGQMRLPAGSYRMIGQMPAGTSLTGDIRSIVRGPADTPTVFTLDTVRGPVQVRWPVPWQPTTLLPMEVLR